MPGHQLFTESLLVDLARDSEGVQDPALKHIDHILLEFFLLNNFAGVCQHVKTQEPFRVASQLVLSHVLINKQEALSQKVVLKLGLADTFRVL